MTQEQVAEVLGISVDKVRWLEYTALKKLRRLMRRAGYTKFDLSMFDKYPKGG